MATSNSKGPKIHMIRISRHTWKLLMKTKEPGDTFDDVILRLAGRIK